MKCRYQRGALSAERNVFHAEITNNINTGDGCQSRTVANLQGKTGFRTVAYRLTMRTDGRNFIGADARDFGINAGRIGRDYRQLSRHRCIALARWAERVGGAERVRCVRARTTLV